MEHTPIPPAELEILKQLKHIKTVFDVGARADTDFFEIWPKASFHLFEPNPVFYSELMQNVINTVDKLSGGADQRVFTQPFGLGDKVGEFYYNPLLQTFDQGEAWSVKDPYGLSKLFVNTLDNYVKENGVKRIDFLKIDTEGYDYKVLKGAKNTLKKCKYIQYEHWDNKKEFHRLLGKEFEMQYVGYRNVLCINRKLVKPDKIKSLVKFLEKGKYKELA